MAEVKYDNQDELDIPDRGVNDTPCQTVSNDNLNKFIDSLNGCPNERKNSTYSFADRYYNIKGTEKEVYEHRSNFNKYHLRLGDCCFQIPPEYISVKEFSNTERVPGVRKISSMKKKFGYSTTDITFSLYFNGQEQINGFEVDSPFHYPYYVDGLRPFLAQCKLSPIMPIENEHLNKTCGIYAVAIQSISISAVKNFPNVLKATINCVECNTSIYTMCPNFMFSDLIEWDLYKYNYQRLMCSYNISSIDNNYKLKELKLDNAVNNNSIKISVIDETQFTTEDIEEANTKNEIDITKVKYIEVINSDEDNFVVEGLNFGVSNIIVNSQLSGHTKPAIQYLGGDDTVVSLQITTIDSEVASKFKSLITNTQLIVRKLKDCTGIGFAKIENNFLSMLGVSYMLIDTVSIDTVPNMPGTYIINLECVNFDTTSSSVENLDGFRPFIEDSKGTMDDCISQNEVGLYNKIFQDTIAEYKLANQNLYPDLMLPTYKEIDDVVEKINKYRAKIGLKPLPYSSYPRTVSKDFILGMPYVSDTFVEPDYYFVYPMFNFEKNKTPIDDVVVSKTVKAGKVNKTYTLTRTESSGTSEDGTTSNDSNTWEGSTGDIPTTSTSTSCDKLGIKATGVTRRYLDLLLSKVGCGYLLGAIGEIMTPQTIASLRWAGGRVRSDLWMGKQIFDCSGIIGWAMYECGYYKTLKEGRIYHLDIYNKHCKKISKSELQPGDIAFSSSHVVTYIGGGKTVEAANPDKGVIIGQLHGKYYCFGRINWPQSIINKYKNYGVKSTSNSTALGASTIDQTINNFSGTSNARARTTNTENETEDNITYARTGARTVSNIKLGTFGGTYDRYDNLIQQYCKEYGLAPNWIKALIKQESQMNPNARSGANAIGLMQLTRSACQEIGYSFNVAELQNPATNIKYGCAYLDKFKSMFNGNYLDLVCAYNMGPYGYKEYLKGKRRLPSETKKHGEKIQANYNTLLSNGGEAKEYTKSGSSSSTSDNNSSSSGGNDSSGGIIGSIVGAITNLWTGTKEVTKEHGNRVSEYNTKLGYPLTTYSPVNNLTISNASKGSLSSVEKINKIEKIKNKITKDLEEAELKIIKEYNTKFSSNLNKAYSEFKDTGYKDSVDDFLDENNDYYISTMTVNDSQYNKRGTMLRAFPTYCILLSDDDSSWYDGKKLWENRYPYKSMVSIQIFHETEQPVGTAKIQVTNFSKNLTKNPTREAYKKSIDKDKGYGIINRHLYKHYGFILGTAKVTQDMIESKNELVTAAKIKPGTRIHVRLGYGSNPLSLNVAFNGSIAEVTTGEIMELIAQSDGAELVNTVVSTKENETNGLMKMQSEPSNIISSLLIDRSSFLNMFNSKWGENSQYGIEHFGLFTGHQALTGREKEYDLCKNIYIGNYKKALFCSNTSVFDGEKNIDMFLYNKLPWDVSQITNNCLPEFVCQPRYHQFDSRLFFGLPTWLYKYRYDITPTGAILEQAKTFQQVHILDCDDILDNKLKCTNKFLNTNIVCMYTLGSDMKASPTLFSDKNIDWSKQKTKVIDSVLQQNYFGPDGIYEWLGFDNGRTNAIATGISNLIDSYSKIYYDDIITLGKPGIFPNDQIFINDNYSEMYGLANVRAVTHSFTPETGFVSTISPSLIAYSKTQDSGSSNTYRTAANLCDLTSNVLNARREVMFMLETMAGAMYDTLRANETGVINQFKESLNKLTPCSDKNWYDGIIKTIGEDNKNSFLYKTLNNNPLYKRIHTSTMPTNYALSLIFRAPLIKEIVDWFEYSNCIGIRPLIYKSYAFVSGVKGQKKLMEGYDESPYYSEEEE